MTLYCDLIWYEIELSELGNNPRHRALSLMEILLAEQTTAIDIRGRLA